RCRPSLQVAQQGDGLDPEPPDRVEDRSVGREDDDVGLRSTATGIEARVFIPARKQKDAHWKTLRLTDPALRRFDSRKLPARRLIALADAPADALHLAAEKLAGFDVERNGHVLPRLDVPQLVFAHIGGDPARTALQEAEEGLSGRYILPGRQAQVCGRAIGRGAPPPRPQP